jgi:hypothetical protein
MSGAKGRRRAVRVVLALSIVAMMVGVAAGFGHVYALSDFIWSAGLHK